MSAIDYALDLFDFIHLLFSRQFNKLPSAQLNSSLMYDITSQKLAFHSPIVQIIILSAPAEVDIGTSIDVQKLLSRKPNYATEVTTIRHSADKDQLTTFTIQYSYMIYHLF